MHLPEQGPEHADVTRPLRVAGWVGRGCPASPHLALELSGWEPRAAVKGSLLPRFSAAHPSFLESRSEPHGGPAGVDTDTALPWGCLPTSRHAHLRLGN